jgi:hypothetical protein
MIKRIRFVTRHEQLTAVDFAEAWRAEVARVRDAPAELRPLRAVACTTLFELAGVDTPHDGISMEWFADRAALRQFLAWHRTESEPGANVVESAATIAIVAEEAVMRGVDWLQQRWAERSVKLKHMALARRATHLTAEQFSERWRNRAGVVGGAGAAPVLTIPAEARGFAYVQNHPLASFAKEWTYDAINEVYFDDLVAMQRRIAFFREHDVGKADAELVSEAVFTAVAEYVVC